MNRRSHRDDKSSLSSRNISGQDGYFREGSMIRKIHREAIILLGGGRSILLQLAHPFVAAGVDDHSNFEAEILNRLFRTLEFMHDLVFCDRQTAQQALRHFHALHQRIRGQLKHRSGHLAPQTNYSGTDPHAKLWVFATFIDTNIKVYEQFISPLTPDERQSYYADALLLAQLMEIPESVLPSSWNEFQEYMNHMVHGRTLAITPTARRLAHSVLYPKLGFLPTLSATLLRFITTGLLNKRFRRDYGLNWSFGDQVIFKSMHSTTRLLRPCVPPWIWQGPLLEGKLTYFLLWGISQKK